MSCCKKAILFLFTLILLAPLRPVFICAQDTQSQIYLDGETHDSSGLFILKIMLSPKQIQLCGLEIDITYDSTKMMLCSCERGDALPSLEFDCSLGEDRIRLLLWGGENSEIGGRIATLCFLPTDYCDGEIEFILSLPTKTSAIYFKDNQILSQNISLGGLRIDLGSSETSTNVVVQNPTELPTELGQENPSAELPTERYTEKAQSDYSSESSPPKSQDGGIFQKILSILLCISSASSTVFLIPIFVPRVFRKGYF